MHKILQIYDETANVPQCAIWPYSDGDVSVEESHHAHFRGLLSVLVSCDFEECGADLD